MKCILASSEDHLKIMMHFFSSHGQLEIASTVAEACMTIKIMTGHAFSVTCHQNCHFKTSTQVIVPSAGPAVSLHVGILKYSKRKDVLLKYLCNGNERFACICQLL